MNREVIEKVYHRDNCKCILCGSGQWLENVPHHCFFKSQYFKEDRDSEWNLITICRNCHFQIHHKGNKEKDKISKILAFKRYTGEYKEKLEKILKEKRISIL
jgi:5-methylcytosine-specific restriction endonuclease McrA